MRREVLSSLSHYPFLRVWCAGFSTGQEAYSLAIVLVEEGLLERSRIWGAEFVGVLLTAASRDGASGLRLIARRRGRGIVQDPKRRVGSVAWRPARL